MEHVRADEGLERGERTPPAPWPARKPPTAGKLGKNFNAALVVQRYLNGEEIAEIAESFGVHPKALNYHLLKDGIREQWRAAQVAVSLADYQEAKQVTRDAPDALSLARAREILRSSQWDLERLEARLFGQKQEVTMGVVVVHVEGELGSQACALLTRIRDAAVPCETQLIESVDGTSQHTDDTDK